MFVILPHQLFNPKYIPKVKVVLWEHPHYFKKYNYNKKKLLLHRSSMQKYYKLLTKKGYKVTYVNFNNSFKLTNYSLYDPVDKIKLPGKYKKLPTPGFLFDKYPSVIRFAPFYKWGKKQLNILPGIESMDKMNRKKLPNNTFIPPLPSGDKVNSRYVNLHFPNNPGTTKGFIYPTTHSTAKKWLTDFTKHRFAKFGDYQDAMAKGESFLFHSVLSSSLNIGLLTPLQVIKYVMKCKVPMNSKEGFIRQIFWREYQRHCYLSIDFSNNFFDNKDKLTLAWYNGTTGIDPVDDCIKRAFVTGYLHHIERLMVIGNYMNLSGIAPKEGYKWFMEFAIDSYEWVMHQNVYDMVFFSSGLTTKRPYVSSSNYILTMSNWKKGKWADIWKDKYYAFLKKHKVKLWKYRYHFSVLNKV